MNKIRKRHSIVNISITAYRAISLLKMLIEQPLSGEEILNRFNADEITCRSLSKDTLRVTLNSLKAVGCTIKRPCASTNGKYVLTSHPFGLKITQKQINILNNLRKNIAETEDWKTVYAFDDLYKKAGILTGNKAILNQLVLSNCFIKVRPEVSKTLLSGETEGKEVIFTYATSKAKTAPINILVDRIFSERGRLYIWGWYFARNSYSYFNAEKIRSIDAIKTATTVLPKKFYKAIYKISGDSLITFKREAEELIIKSEPNEIIVEYAVMNEFKFFRRLLSFGEDFMLISPERAKEELIKRLDLSRYGE